MAEGMRDEFEHAVNEVDSLLGQHTCRRLSSEELDSVAHFTPMEGWRVKTDLIFKGDKLDIFLLVKDSFPYSIPIITTKPVLKVLDLPHIETGGKLCVWPDDTPFDPLSFEYVNTLLLDAYNLLKKNFNNQLSSDFQDGFLSYWSRYCSGNFKSLSLCNLTNEGSRLIFVTYNKLYGAIFHDTSEELETWLARKGLVKHKIYRSMLISLNHAWKPSEYPTEVSDVIEVLRKEGNADDKIGCWLQSVLIAKVDHPAMLVRVKTRNGTCAISLRLEGSINSKSTSHIRRGYRKDKIPHLVMTQKASKLKVFAGTADRCDYDWVNGRDNNSLVNIRGGKVVILGVGSVGSSVIILLIKSGVRDILISDNDLLEPENISRHHLGLSNIRLNKVEALKSQINKEYPHVNIQITTSKWNEDEVFLVEMQSADVIVSCTADWCSDLRLLDLARKEELICPIVFGFTEAHAAASHCIVNPISTDEAQEFFTSVGELVTPVVKWKENTSRQLPTCGGSFQPYGAVELSFSHSIIAETVIDLLIGNIDPNTLYYRAWIGRKRLVELNQGEWNEDWIEKYSNPYEGGFIFDA